MTQTIHLNELKSYELGSDFDKRYKLENAISAVSREMLTDITSYIYFKRCLIREWYDD